MSTLPYRLSEKAFRRFEKDIATAVTIYPEAMELTPEGYGMAVSTLEPRFRDAIKSLYVYRWPTDHVNMSKFVVIYSDLVVSHPDEHIYVGSRANIKALKNVAPAGVVTVLPEPIAEPIPSPSAAVPAPCIEIVDLAMKNLLCDIVAKGQGGPFLVRGLDKDDVSRLEESYDVRIDDNKDGTFTIL